MSPENTELLYSRYADIFKQKDLPITESCMGWGFECGDGWFNIIDNLCHAIYTRKNDVQVAQVKQKYGSLRFYIDGGDDYVEGLIRMAELMSAVTCEECGDTGKQNSKGWITAKCEACRIINQSNF